MKYERLGHEDHCLNPSIFNLSTVSGREYGERILSMKDSLYMI
jgi:hypothetical protein